MTSVLLSRIQFAFTIGYHFLYVPFSIGLGLVLILAERRYRHTGADADRAASDFWIMPVRKLTNQARPANTAPTTLSMMIIRFNMALNSTPVAVASVDWGFGQCRQCASGDENAGNARRRDDGGGRFVDAIPPSAAERLV